MSCKYSFGRRNNGKRNYAIITNENMSDSEKQKNLNIRKIITIKENICRIIKLIVLKN